MKGQNNSEVYKLSCFSFRLIHFDLFLWLNDFLFHLFFWSKFLIYRVVENKHPILFFIPRLCFTILLHIFSDGLDSRPEKFYRYQYGSNWTIYYAAADKSHQGVLCHNISSSDTEAMQVRFWQEQCTPFLSPKIWRQTDFVAKYASMIFIRCSVV